MSIKQSVREVELDTPVQSGPDLKKLEEFTGKILGDLGASLSTALASIGDSLGLYKAMVDGTEYDSASLSQKTKTNERYIREWLLNQAAGGYVSYNKKSGKYFLPKENAVALTDEESPFFVGGGIQTLSSMIRAQDRIAESFKTGKGMLWGEHHHGLFQGTERFFKPGYNTFLVKDWLPALDGVVEKLQRGAQAADIGCGHGISTMVLAKAFPNSKFFGFDNHLPSIERATQIAKEDGVVENCKFAAADAASFPGNNYDLICYFDCLHDMGAPVDAIKRAREVIKDDGTLLIVEPMAGRTVEENFNPVGLVYSGASVLCCTPNAIASGGTALGTVASDDALKEVVNQGGFTRFRRAAETPFNRVFEARV